MQCAVREIQSLDPQGKAPHSAVSLSTTLEAVLVQDQEQQSTVTSVLRLARTACSTTMQCAGCPGVSTSQSQAEFAVSHARPAN